jgi:hypothetical protein
MDYGMLSRLIRALRAAQHERGAGDPILIISGIAITLILLVGGTFAVAGFIANAQNLNAKADLDRVAVSQAAALTQNDTFLPLAWGEKVLSDKKNNALSIEPIGFVPSDGVNLVIRSSPAGWAALIESASGAHYVRTSLSTETIEVEIGDIRDDFEIRPKGSVQALASNGVGGSATTTSGGSTLRFPAGVNEYQMAWQWVDALWGLDPEVYPPDAPAATTPLPEEPNVPAPVPSQPVSPSPNPTGSAPPVEAVVPAFEAGPGAYEIKSVVWNQMSAFQVCVDVTVRGTGGNVNNWYLTMNAATAPFNSGFNKGDYQFPTWGYGFDGEFQNGKIKVVGQNHNEWNNFSTLTNGQERTLRICNYNTPKPPVTSNVTVEKLSQQPGEWTWSANYRVSAPEAKFFTSWKIQVDISALNANYRGSSPIHSDPGSNDLKITQVGPNTLEIEGIGWPTTGVRHDKNVEFRIGR